MLNLGDATQAINSAFCRMTHSVYTLCGFQKLKPVECGLCILWELQAKEIQVQEPLPDKLQFTILSLQIPDEPHFPDTPQIFQYSSSSNSNKCMFMSTRFLKII